MEKSFPCILLLAVACLVCVTKSVRALSIPRTDLRGCRGAPERADWLKNRVGYCIEALSLLPVSQASQ